MMRTPTLQGCLESPHLWFDETAAALVKKDLETADKFLAEWKGKKDYLEQTNALYQAMYCATMALVHSIRYKATGFRCIVTVLDEFFVKKGLLTFAQLEDLLRAQRIEGSLEQNSKAAEEYVARVKEVVKV